MSTLRFQPMMESRPIREIAYEVLKHAIVTGEIPAVSALWKPTTPSASISAGTPLREALRKLERDGLVEYVLRRGVVVRAFTIEDVDEIYTIRNALEMLTLPAIIERAAPEDIASLRAKLHEMDKVMAMDDIEKLSPMARAFHSAITHISGKNRILRVIESQDEFINRFSAMAIRQEDRRVQAHEEHHKLVDYIEQRDLEHLEKLTRKHIERSKENCLAALELQRHRE